MAGQIARRAGEREGKSFPSGAPDARTQADSGVSRGEPVARVCRLTPVTAKAISRRAVRLTHANWKLSIGVFMTLLVGATMASACALARGKMREK